MVPSVAYLPVDRESYMIFGKRPMRPLLFAGAACFLLVADLRSAPLSAEETVTIAQSADYFPDAVGSRWTYKGQITDGPLQTIENKFFTNVSTVTGTMTIKGVAVTVFHDSNPGNHGPSDSYYRRDAVGIVYYGSDPGTPLEKQITPYQIFRFPLTIPSSFQQFDRTGLDFGTDMDRDGTDEKVDVRGWSSVVGRESITVPAGTFHDAIKVEAKMTMRIHLSAGRRTIAGLDVMTAWFAKGVGLVKYSERQELSAVKDDRGVVTEIAEELEQYEVKPGKDSLGRLESPSEGIFGDHPGDQELGQVVLTTGFRAYP
jgi:hypothetical protein